MKFFRFALMAAGLVAGLAASPAMAAYTYCPGTDAVTDREFGVQVTAGGFSVSCYQTDTNANDPGSFPPFTYIDKDQEDDELPAEGFSEGWFSVTGLGSTSGTFTITSQLTSQFDEFIFVLKVGGGQGDPDWYAFKFSSGTSGDWTGAWQVIAPEGSTANTALSHASLFGYEGDAPPSGGVPEPAPIALIGAALAGMAWMRRRARAKSISA
jgi:hypothetical protein